MMRTEETWTEQVTCTKRWGRGWITGPYDSEGPALCPGLSGSLGAGPVELAGRDAEIARNLSRIPGRGHWGIGRPTRAMGRDWGRGRAEGSCCLGTSPLPHRALGI